MSIDNSASSCYFSIDEPVLAAVPGILQEPCKAAFLRQERQIIHDESL